MKMTVLMLTAFAAIATWGSFFYIFFTDDTDKSATMVPLRAEWHEERDASFPEELNSMPSSAETASGDSEEINDASLRGTNSLNENNLPDIQKGDAISYGDGVSIDDLLEN